MMSLSQTVGTVSAFAACLNSVPPWQNQDYHGHTLEKNINNVL